MLLKRVGLKAMWNFVKVFTSYSTYEAFGLQDKRHNKQADQSGLPASLRDFHRSESAPQLIMLIHEASIN